MFRVLICFLLFVTKVSCFLTQTVCKRFPRVTHKQAYLNDLSSTLIAVGDYATEIENAVGTEIYTPIFKAGLFLFLSGLISAFIAAFIISKSNSWDDLNDEFERGKESQLIVSELLNPSDDKSEVPTTAVSSNVLQEVQDLDL
jgi:hypothetical protein